MGPIFKLGDFVYLVNLREVIQLKTEGGVDMANKSFAGNVRHATDYEIQECF